MVIATSAGCEELIILNQFLNTFLVGILLHLYFINRLFLFIQNKLHQSSNMYKDDGWK